MGPQSRSARCRQPVGLTAVVTGNRLNEVLTFQTAQRLVEGARRQSDPGELLNVFCQGIAMLGALRQAGEDQGGGPRVATERAQRGRALVPSGSRPWSVPWRRPYIGSRSIAQR